MGTSKPAPAPSAPEVVMVVDDEPAVGRAIRRLLTGEREVVTYTRGHQALEALAGGAKVAALLCDLMMPDMTGMAFVEEVRRRFPQVLSKVAVMSGGAFTPDGRAFLKAWRGPQLVKPFSGDELRQALETLQP